jgi:hypothetical protein
MVIRVGAQGCGLRQRCHQLMARLIVNFKLVLIDAVVITGRRVIERIVRGQLGDHLLWLGWED